MREKLFRAKRIDNGEWVEGNLIYSFDVDEEFRAIIVPVKDSGMYEWDCNPDLGLETWYKVDSKTICQYTGLSDKNGNRIWENDICEMVYDGRVNIYVIVWDAEELDFKGTNDKEKYGSNFEYLGCCEEIVRIGNVFENQELLKGEDKCKLIRI